MFWLFWQLVGVLIGLIAVLVILWGLALVLSGGFIALRAIVRGIQRYHVPEISLWTLGVIVTLFGVGLDSGQRTGGVLLGVLFCVAAIAVTARRHHKAGTIPFRCKCGVWVHVGKCPKLRNEDHHLGNQ